MRDGKPTKAPYNPRTGGKAQSTNRQTFAPLPVALGALERGPHDGGKYDGIGVGVFGTLAAIDIDHCISDTGELSEMVADIMQTMSAYVEYSPSGRGLRILFTVPVGFEYDRTRYYINHRKAGLEVYIAGVTHKFVTVTGNALTPGTDLEERGEQVAVVLEKYMVRPRADTPTEQGDEDGASGLDDLALIERAKHGHRGAEFAALWKGDTSAYDGDESRADMALCDALAFWTGKDPARMDRLFRHSGLMRAKWDEMRGADTYGSLTIANAIRTGKMTYDPQYNASGVKPPDYSDAGNAAVFSRVYRDDLIFVDALGWLWWTGQKWDRDDHHATALALDLSERMLRDALDQYSAALHAAADALARFTETKDEMDGLALNEAKAAAAKAKAYLTHAQNSRNAIRIKNMLALSKPALVLKADKLDANPFDLNTPAGIVNLTTGQLRPHERGAYCSKMTLAAPDVAGRDMWETFLDTVTCHDPGLKEFLQVVTGMALSGKVFQECLILACGGGANGKSTCFNTISEVLGDYAGSIDIKVLTVDRTNKGASMATLRGKRLVITGELEEHQRLSASMLKRITSTDVITIEEKYHQPEDITPSHAILAYTNHLPRVGSTDDGTWRRLIVAPFNATIQQTDSVQNYGAVLVQECGGAVLAWGIDGAVKFAHRGFKLPQPEAVARATAEYRRREDWLANFINERCIREPNAREGARALYSEYRTWAAESGEYVQRENVFADAMKDAGYQKLKMKGKCQYVGVKIDFATKFQSPYAASI